MGMFDELTVYCPKCGNTIIFQSKAGECTLKRYTINTVPPDIAGDLNDEWKACPNCMAVVKIQTQTIVNVISDIGSR